MPEFLSSPYSEALSDACGLAEVCASGDAVLVGVGTSVGAVVGLAVAVAAAVGFTVALGLTVGFLLAHALNANSIAAANKHAKSFFKVIPPFLLIICIGDGFIQ